MKNVLSVLSALLLLSLVACGDKKNDAQKIEDELYQYDSTEFITEPINDTSSVELGYKFKKGEKILYRLATISETSQKIVADTTINNNVFQEIVYLIEFKPTAVETDGTIETEIKIVGLKLNARVNDEKFNFDASSQKDSAQVSRFPEFASLFNNPFSVRFTKHGEITEVFRIDRIANKFFKLRSADSVDASTKNMFMEEFSTGMLKPIIGQIIRKVTDKKVSKDSTWASPEQVIPMMVFQMNYTNTYKVLGTEKLKDDKLAVIEAGLIYKVSGDNKFEEQGVKYNFSKPVSKGDGKIYFNTSNGRIQKSKTTSSTAFSFTMESDSPQGKQKAKREEFVSNTNILELLK
jgi:hypothetical protein